MHRLRPLAVIGPVAAVVVLVPIFAAVTVAADPVVVRPGETLTSISRRTGVPVERIVELNRLTDPNRILIGQTLRLEEDRSVEASSPPPADVVHVVRRGETTWGIAQHYGVTVAAIAAANGLSNPSRIFGGQRLAIPGTPTAAPTAARPSTPSAPADVVHVVRRGETTWGIAQHYGVTVAAIAAANGLSNPSRIFGGQRLAIPRAADAGLPAAPAPATSALAAAAPAMPPGMAAVVAARDRVRRLVVAEADAHGVPASLALAVAWQESGWRQGVVSYAGAVGVMQLLPTTADWVAATMLRAPVNVYDARDNIRAGVRLLAHYLVRYDGNVDLALAAYYQGETGADRHGIYAVSRPYIASIRSLERLFRR